MEKPKFRWFKKISQSILENEYSAAWLTALIFASHGILCRSLFKNLNSFTWKSFFVSSVFSFVLWWFLRELQRLMPVRGRKLFAAVIAVCASAMLLSQTVVYLVFGEFITPFMLIYAVQDIRFFFDYFFAMLLRKESILFLLLFAAFFKLWDLNLNRSSELQITQKRLGVLLGSFVLMLVMANQIQWETSGQIKFADGAIVSSMSMLAQSNEQKGLHASIRKKVTSTAPRGGPSIAKPDIFLFIGESWGKENVNFYGYSKKTMPFLTEWIQENHAHTFHRAFTNSTATDVSLPSILTGVSPEENLKKFHEMPLLWDWAKAAGYTTIFITPQRLKWAHLDEYLKTPGPDIFVLGNSISNVMVNDQGVDDILAAEKFNEIVLAQKKDEPLLMVFFGNALHFPFLDASEKVPSIPEELTTRYEKALYITDRSIQVMFAALKARGREQETLYLLTADHGEVENSRRVLPRIVSFYDEVLSVPFIVKTPGSWQGCEEALVANGDTNVQNLDIVPTVAHQLSSNETDSANKGLIGQLKGSDLCSQVAKDRMLVHLNTNGIRQWDQEGFALTKGPYKMIYSTLEGLFVFDIESDPQNSKNILSDLRGSQDLLGFESRIDGEYELKRIWGNQKFSDFLDAKTAKETRFSKSLPHN